MAADQMTNYLPGGARHSPAANVADPDLFGRNPVGTMSRPLDQSEVGGTSGILNSAGRSKPGKSTPRGMPSPTAISSPLDTSGHADIIAASGLGKKVSNPAKDQDDEQDQDQLFNRAPARPVSTGNPGDFANPHPLTATIRGETQRPTLADYPNLNYDSMPANVSELQQRLGVPDFFGGAE